MSDGKLRALQFIEQEPGPRVSPHVRQGPLADGCENDFAGVNEEWLKWFPVDPPARQGAKLPVRVPGLKVSIAMIAEA